jgi:hypothetical protein
MRILNYLPSRKVQPLIPVAQNFLMTTGAAEPQLGIAGICIIVFNFSRIN